MESSERTTYQHYEVERRPDGSLFELGRGAMGITYKALDSNLRVPVALKVIAGALLPDARARSRFLREARAAAQLRHSNVATVYHLGQEEDFCFYTMEFIDGETCEARVRRDGPLDPVTALRVCSQVARALQAAHARGLLHRDLKPSNLMVSQEGGDLLVKVIDFGLVKPLQQDDAEAGASLSGGLFLGTPLYASPEQCASEETLDGRSDLYSLGATLWFLLAGEPLFKGSMRSVMAQHLTKPPPVEGLRGQPPAVLALLRDLLAKEPADRPADAATLRARVAEVLREVEGDRAGAANAGTAAGAGLVGTAGTGTAAAALGTAAGGTVGPGSARASFTLDDVLRKRGGLLPGEVLFLLPRLAALLDHVVPGEPLPDLSPRNVRGHFTDGGTEGRGSTSAGAGARPGMGAGTGTRALSVDALLGQPPPQWPPFSLSLDGLTPATTLAVAPTGDGTLLGAPASAPSTPVESLGCLVYELFAGAPLSAGRPYRPLPILTESGNDALRRALPLGQPRAGYAGVGDFCSALRRALDGGSSSTALPVSAPASAGLASPPVIVTPANAPASVASASARAANLANSTDARVAARDASQGRLAAGVVSRDTSHGTPVTGDPAAGVAALASVAAVMTGEDAPPALPQETGAPPSLPSNPAASGAEPGRRPAPHPGSRHPAIPLPGWVLPVGAAAALLVLGAGLFFVGRAVFGHGDRDTNAGSSSPAATPVPPDGSRWPAATGTLPEPPATPDIPPWMPVAPEPPASATPAPSPAPAAPGPRATPPPMPTASLAPPPPAPNGGLPGTGSGSDTPKRTPPRPTPSPRRQPAEPTPAPEPTRPPKKPTSAASSEGASGKGGGGKSGLHEQQRKAIEQQHRSGNLSDSEYRQALKALGE